MSRSAAMLIMGVFTLYFLTPIWWLLVSSSKTGGEITSTAPLWFTMDSAPTFLANLGNLFTYSDGVFGRWLANSALYAGLGALMGTVIAAMCGYALAKYEFRGREALFNIVLSGVLVPATALALPLFLIFSEVKLTNTLWAVFLPSLVSPFGVYLARIYAAASVPTELLEAARLDGSSEVRTFFTVSTRLMAPALVTIFLFQFVAIWNNFFLPLIMLRDQVLFPVTLGLYAWNSQISQIPELRVLVIVGALVSILPLIGTFLALQRFWSSGLGAGSVK
ncbi:MULTISPECIES: carbohydrate ABC transporter permease [Micrococcaceae]|jgi:multiple sugar transport system permease protein|uniref:carbohydrate ABC transporter permease n=1 Tax=Micrococcaceae TaxID=1268 RepID=UPI0012F7B0CE|nr:MULTISPECIES: carbohydrate ABC transporter permease [Pseudarthrobacter]MEA3550026.1 carbohydrate ABC transporter permease [Pseudarthrobacter sp. C1]MUU72213.1 ABC transporter permease subunit [Pseudarthrobacter sp. GA104]WPU11439.1 carbohydrate ABC transporter permease [Pseudarthrobacter oxydans]HET7782204.1 carbohydrate ABC transporter permease [Arthrobacter sp.]